MIAFCVIFVYFTISSIFIQFIDEKTKYTGDKFKIPGDREYLIDKFPDNYIFLIILIGPLSYLILNHLKKWRKINYYNYKLITLKKYKDFSFVLYNNYDDYINEMKKIERLLALNKLNKK